MILELNGRQRNLLLLIGLGLILVVLTAALIIGHRQDEVFRANYQLYQRAIAYMGQKEYELALQDFRALDDDSQAGYQVLYMSAFCELQTGDYSAAARHMLMAREARPALVQDPKFLLRYGAVLFESGKHDEASLYLKESLKYTDDPAIISEAERYLAQLGQEHGGGR